MTKVLSLDFELASVPDLGDVGSDVWTKHPSTMPILAGFAIDFEEPRAIGIDLLGLDVARLPAIVTAEAKAANDAISAAHALRDKLLNAVEDPDVEIWAWNANFEWNVWNNVCAQHLGWPELPIDRFHCTMATAACAGLPMALDDAAAALNCVNRKDAAGHGTMKRMARPRKIDVNGTIHWWHREDAGKVKDLIKYNLADVRVEREIHTKIPRMTKRERGIWLADQAMNSRGLPVDAELLTQMHALTLQELLRINADITTLTNGDVSGSTQNLKLLAWVQARGYPHNTLERDTLLEFIQLPAFTRLGMGVQAVLKLRAEAAKTSTAKLTSIANYAQIDGYARNMVQYGAAVRTLRWGGRGPQIQNFPKPVIKKENVLPAINEILAGMDAEGLRHLYGNPLDVVSSCLRGVFKAPAGMKLVIADYSAIEAIVLAWLAQDEDLLDVFRRGEDIYLHTAKAIGSKNRTLGKVLRLACIAENELVLTDCGLVPIEHVADGMLLWDGVEWVAHDGVVFQGEKEIIEYDGLRATSDHKVWTEGRSDPVPFGLAASEALRLVRSGEGGRPFRVLEGDRPDFRPHDGNSAHSLPMRSMRDTETDELAEFTPEQKQWLSMPLTPEQISLSNKLATTSRLPHDDGTITLPEPGGPKLGELWRARDYFRFQLSSGSGGVDRREPRRSIPDRITDRPDRQRPRLLPGQPSLGDPTPAGFQHPAHNLAGMDVSPGRVALRGNYGRASVAFRADPQGHSGESRFGGARKTQGLADYRRTARVYDILNAGPRRRFTVSGRLVSNCGYGMGAAKFVETAKTYGLTLSLVEARDHVASFRATNPKIVQLWHVVENRAQRAIQSGPGLDYSFKRLNFRMADPKGRLAGSLLMKLPSGRHLVYRAARIEDGRIKYWGVNQLSRKWEEQDTYGGKLVENATQACARDLLAEAVVQIEDTMPGCVRATVHDEIVAMARDGDAKGLLFVMQTIMGSPPAWGAGLPLSSAGAVVERYGKL
jgi:DNA polymerase